MKGFPRTGTMVVCLMLSLGMMVSGCKSATTATTADAATDPNNPANANVVPISDSTSGTTSTASTNSAAPAPSAAPAASAAPAQYSTAQYNQDNGYGQEPETYTQQPPPELPQYEQPPCPQPGDIWTPGYWAYAQPTGYYWVPGAWVQAPYVGALWTPGYWGSRGGRYAFYRGYWGRHIGYYGGVNYGFGYVGFGYQGGYWRGNEFAYNTAVNRVNTSVVRNVYDYRINNVSVNRISYNGPGGVQYRPRTSEVFAIREEHTAPMAAQVELRQTAVSNRQMFYNVNQGRPATVVETRAVIADRDIRPPAEIHYERGERPAEVQHPMPEQRGGSDLQHMVPERGQRDVAHGNGRSQERPEPRGEPQRPPQNRQGQKGEQRPEQRPDKREPR
ncbi:MAG TPA: hypothetical protein VG267_07495 [Terracidiphilus sp.]|nr:hypothetical protein [Terracidiphilus sp.]